MARQLIADRIEINPRYVRAVDIARDLPDPHALDGYIPTSRASDGLRRLSRGLTPHSSQRAFRITGPYGSGKSSFGLLLAKLVQQEEVATAIARDVLADETFVSSVPMVLVGRRTSLARDMLAAIASTAREHFGTNDTLAEACDRLAEVQGSNRIETKAVLDHLTTLSQRIEQSKGIGLLVLVDEMGRFLEFAAANQAEEDPALFQQLAERASGSAHPNLAVVAFLHHRFDDYLAGHDDWSSKEWARSAERYEEIAFSEPREQAVHLLAHALTPKSQHSSTVRKVAETLFVEAKERSLFAIAKPEMRALARALYPLHPAALGCLTSAAARFGQHDRSIFSFLQSSEPAGFQHFAHAQRYDANNWYRLDDVFDYFASLGGLRFDSRDRDRRWELGRDAVEALAGEETTKIRVLKAVAVLAVLEPIPGLRADSDTLSWGLDIGLKDIRRALESLVSDRVLYERAASRDFSLWSNSSVDLGYWLNEAERAVSKPSRLDGEIATASALRPIIAQRHYHETGTLRSFDITIGDDPKRFDELDGQIVILPMHPTEAAGSMDRRAADLSERLGPLALVHLRRIEKQDLALAYQLQCWRWIETECAELRMDDLARSEVARTIADLDQRLQSRLFPLAFGTGADHWYHTGKRETIANRAALSRRLSRICDDVFAKAPILRNELVNRDKLSSAIAAARMRLLKSMIENENTDQLGLTGAPPERTIYLSLFQATSMHRKEDGRFGFHPPQEANDRQWRALWDHLGALVTDDAPVSFETLIAEMANPPFGLRAGPALLLIAAVMLHYRSTIALIERGTFQPELTEAHFMRLAKNPAHFALKRLSAQTDAELLRFLSAELTIFSGKRPAAQLKPIVEALFLWWRNLSEYARVTRQVDKTAQAVRAVLKKASEPIELLLVALPDACKARSADGIDIGRYTQVLDLALQQLADALPQLRRQVEVRLVSAFGTNSLADLRAQIRSDYKDHLLELGDYKLRAFVDRAMNEDLTEELWLDGVASLLAGKRLESWDDNLLDHFGFEVRRIAQDLARRLAALREARAQSAPVTAIHITSSNGSGESFFLHDGEASHSQAAEELRKALKGIERPEAVLIEVLRAIINERREQKTE